MSGGPEIGLINLVCLQMSRFYGLPTQATGVSTDAKACDLQAGAEGMMSGLAAVLAGADSLIAAGSLDAVQNHSLAKTVLDADTVGMIRRFCRPEPIDAAKALMDDIVEVGIGGHYLGRRSTRTLSRSGELWRPALFRRGSWEEYAARPLADGCRPAGARADRHPRGAAAGGRRRAGDRRRHRLVPEAGDDVILAEVEIRTDRRR